MIAWWVVILIVLVTNALAFMWATYLCIAHGEKNLTAFWAKRRRNRNLLEGLLKGVIASEPIREGEAVMLDKDGRARPFRTRQD